MNDKSDKGFVLRIKINQYFIFVLNVKKKNIKNKNKRKIISLKPFRGTAEIYSFTCTEQMACSLPLILLSYN